MTTEAVIFIPADRMAAEWRDMAITYCVERGYAILSVVSRWQDVVTELAAHPKAVTVVGRLDMLTRVEAVVDQRTKVRDSSRRPRRIIRVRPS